MRGREMADREPVSGQIRHRIRQGTNVECTVISLRENRNTNNKKVNSDWNGEFFWESSDGGYI